MIAVTAFRQFQNELEVQVDDPQQLFAQAKYLPRVPKTIQIDHLNSHKNLEIVKSANPMVTKVRLPDFEPNSHEYSIIFIDLVTGNFLEIIRQSEDFLAKKFGFKRSAGYCIAGRRNVLLGQYKKVQEQAPYVFFGDAVVPLANKAADKFGSNGEIQIATEILEWMFSKNLNTGPINRNHKSYELATFEQKIAMLEKGKYAVQCATFRDLFVHAAAVKGLDVRCIGALNYSPQHPDLLSYTHALCEIWVSTFQRYIIFDPWFGGLMVTKDGSPIGAEQLQALTSLEGLNLTSVVPEVERLIIDGAGNPTQYHFRFTDVSLHSIFFNKKVGSCMPGYFEYFQHVIIRRVVVRRRLLMYPAMGYRMAASVGRKLAKMTGRKI